MGMGGKHRNANFLKPDTAGIVELRVTIGSAGEGVAHHSRRLVDIGGDRLVQRPASHQGEPGGMDVPALWGQR